MSRQIFSKTKFFIFLFPQLFLMLGAQASSDITVENFEAYSVGSAWPRVDSTQIMNNCGIGTSSNKCLRVGYVPQSNGTARLTKKLPIPAFDHYVLTYDVYFEPGFQFVKGGKMPGLGPVEPTSGCNPVISDAWSARLMWQPSGAVRDYYYSQDRSTDCGDGEVSAANIFKTGQWHHVEINVKLNSEDDEFNGYMILKVDDVIVADDRNLRFRKSYTSASLINNVFFSTFFGGNTSDWAPSTTVYARYDNFRVTPVGTLTDELSSLVEIGSVPAAKPVAPKLALSTDIVVDTTLLHYSFDNSILTEFTTNAWKTLFPATNWIVGLSSYRVDIDSNIHRGATGKAMRVFFPKDVTKRGDNGVMWQASVESGHPSLTLSYWMYIEDDFNYENGGKLPGFGYDGKDTQNEWKAYLSWRNTGNIYLNWQTSAGFNQERLLFKDQVPYLKKGEWQLIKMELTLNTAGVDDGLIRIWMNDIQVGEVNRINFNPNGTPGPINKLMFNAYFEQRSNSGVISTIDQWAWFDDIKVEYNVE